MAEFLGPNLQPKLAVVIGVSLGLAAGSAQALIMRHDRPDDAYRSAGPALRAYCQLNAPDGGGVLVAPRWILTAAHLTGDLKPGQEMSCGGKATRLLRAVNHPQWDGKKNDIALLELATPLDDVPVARIWTDREEAGMVLNLVGHYQAGTGLTGSTEALPRGLRGGTNKVATTDSYWLRFVMDPPESAQVTDLEAVSGSGDSGAPAWTLHDGRAYVVGVGSHSRDLNKNGREPDYGDEDVYARVSTYAPWIQSQIGSASP